MLTINCVLLLLLLSLLFYVHRQIVQGLKVQMHCLGAGHHGQHCAAQELHILAPRNSSGHD